MKELVIISCVLNIISMMFVLYWNKKSKTNNNPDLITELKKKKVDQIVCTPYGIPYFAYRTKFRVFNTGFISDIPYTDYQRITNILNELSVKYNFEEHTNGNDKIYIWYIDNLKKCSKTNV